MIAKHEARGGAHLTHAIEQQGCHSIAHVERATRVLGRSWRSRTLPQLLCQCLGFVNQCRLEATQAFKTRRFLPGECRIVRKLRSQGIRAGRAVCVFRLQSGELNVRRSLSWLMRSNVSVAYLPRASKPEATTCLYRARQGIHNPFEMFPPAVGERTERNPPRTMNFHHEVGKAHLADCAKRPMPS